jgi:M6 family metalloprotease-like protein
MDKLTKEAIDLMVQKPYFSGSKYCLSETTVDGFLFLFPGKEEDALKIHEDFWGHQYWMEWNGSTFNYKPYQAGGFSFNTYAFLAQKEDGNESNLNELGILAHEFSHVMGLSDLYAYDSNNNFISGPNPWDVMTQGMYNSNGRKPPKYSAFERESMGWLTLTELSASDEIYSLMLLDKMEAYSVTNPKNNNEYYVIEYRPKVGFDSGINNTGVLVWYIDYDSNVWDNNNPNDDPSHQRVAVKEVLLGTQSSKTSYSPFTFYDDSSSTVPGIFSFIKGTGDKVCFTTNKNKMGFVCEESSSSVIASSSSVEESSSSATVLIENHLRKSNFKIAVLGRNLQVYLPIVGEKVLKVMDVQGNLVHLGRFTGDNETLTLQNKGVYYLQISLNNELLVSRPVKIR